MSWRSTRQVSQCIRRHVSALVVLSRLWEELEKKARNVIKTWLHTWSFSFFRCFSTCLSFCFSCSWLMTKWLILLGGLQAWSWTARTQDWALWHDKQVLNDDPVQCWELIWMDESWLSMERSVYPGLKRVRGSWMGKGYVWYSDPSSQGKVAPEHEGKGGGTVAWGISLEVLISTSMQSALQEKWSVPSKRVRSDYAPTNSRLHFLHFWCWWREFVECQSHLWAMYWQHRVQRTWRVPSEKLPFSRGRFSLLKVNVRFEVWTEEEQEWFGDTLCTESTCHDEKDMRMETRHFCDAFEVSECQPDWSQPDGILALPTCRFPNMATPPL